MSRLEEILPGSVEALRERLAESAYFAEPPLATAIFLALKLGRPLLLEGDAGVGKTEVAKALSRMLATRLIRLQCHEGLDLHSALYEWDYSRQLLHIRLLEAAGEVDVEVAEQGLYRREFLLRRPLLEALESSIAEDLPPILLIDELDRADEEFEAFLLELLSDFQVSIPELGTLKAEQPPIVILTSNRTREVHDALRRRCLYAWIDYPDAAKEYEILRRKAPEAEANLARQVVEFVQKLRHEDLYKKPGVAESLDWAMALHALGEKELTPENVSATLGVLLKYQDDLHLMGGSRVERLLSKV
jgi:MoxR-like ATPase